MLYVRTTKTASGATAVQVVRYQNRKKIILRHLGSAHTKSELRALQEVATLWIEKTTQQSSLFPVKPHSPIIPLNQCRYLGFRYGLLYESLYKLCTLFKFHLLNHTLLIDLVVARIAEPSSKIQSMEYLEEFMGIKHQRRNFYRQLPMWISLQEKIEAKVLTIAKKEFHFTFCLVFYDVTTLYFESFEPDDLHKLGFSKDHKSQQPQILIGLLVNTDGFPIAYQVFEGNTFEGHTLIPIICAFKRKHKIDNLTVVADAAMISLANITALATNGLHYIVGARTANLSPSGIAEISAKLRQQDGATLRRATAHGDLICEFSAKRFAKDQREMEKQIAKAESLLNNPSAMKRAKFIKSPSQGAYVLHTDLVEKTKLLLGIKGYYTDLLESDLSNQLVIERYHSLWHVEQAFRIAKSDLQMRPIYHFKDHPIKAHILICFMALAICKYMELKSNKSTKSIVKSLKQVTDARILNTLNNEELSLRSEISDETKLLLTQLGVWY